jgi:hypothetical protein
VFSVNNFKLIYDNISALVVVQYSVKFACCLRWVSTFICHFERRRHAEGFREQGVEENIWT